MILQYLSGCTSVFHLINIQVFIYEFDDDMYSSKMIMMFRLWLFDLSDVTGYLINAKTTDNLTVPNRSQKILLMCLVTLQTNI